MAAEAYTFPGVERDRMEVKIPPFMLDIYASNIIEHWLSSSNEFLHYTSSGSLQF